MREWSLNAIHPIIITFSCAQEILIAFACLTCRLIPRVRKWSFMVTH